MAENPEDNTGYIKMPREDTQKRIALALEQLHAIIPESIRAYLDLTDWSSMISINRPTGTWVIGGEDTHVPVTDTIGTEVIEDSISIGSNGNWYVGALNTGVSAKGIKGDKGEPGKDGTMTFSDLTAAQKESLRGEDGADAVVYEIVTTVDTIVRKVNGGYSPTDIDKITLYTRKPSGNLTNALGRFIITEFTSEDFLRYTVTVEQPGGYVGYFVKHPTTAYITIEALPLDSDNLLARKTIPVINEVQGPKGDPGTGGTSGTGSGFSLTDETTNLDYTLSLALRNGNPVLQIEEM